MSAGKGDKWRKTDFKKYYSCPLWDNLEKKKALAKREGNATISSDAKDTQNEKQRAVSGG